MSSIYKLFITLTIIFFYMNSTTLMAQDKSPRNLLKSDLKKEFPYTTFPNDPTQTRMYKLDNGLTIYLSPNHKEPRININVAVKAGSKNDPSTHTGLAHYLEHLLFKGTDRFGTLDFQKEKPLLEEIENLYEKYGATTDEDLRKKIYHDIDSISGKAAQYAIPNEIDKMFATIGAKGTNAFTGFDMTVYVNDIPSNQLASWAQIEAERYRNPQMRLFHTELETVYEEKNRAIDNDGRQAMEAMLSALFRNNKYGSQTTLGTVEHLKRPSIKEIKKFFYSYYVPNNMAVILTGDFNPDEAIQILAQNFGSMQAQDIPTYTYHEEGIRSSPQSVDVYGPNAENITIAWRMPGALSEYNDMVTLMSQVLYNEKAGILDVQLNKKQKLLSSSAGYWSLKDEGVFMLDAEPLQGQSLDQCRELLLQQIDDLKQGHFDAELIAAVIENMQVRDTRALESNRSRTSSLQRIFINEESWDHYLDRFTRYKKITKDNIVAFANKYFTQDYVVVNKYKGKAPEVAKVVKPPITPVQINRNDKSDFAQAIYEVVPAPIQPVFVDFKNDILFGKTLNHEEVMYVKNTDNDLFSLNINFEIGTAHSKLLPLAFELIEYLPTTRYTSESWSKTMYDLAGSYSFSTSDEYSTISISGREERFTQILDLVEDLIAHCQADTKAFDDLKERILKNREDRKSDKNYLLTLQKMYAAYGPVNPMTNTLSNDEIKNLDINTLLDFIHNLFSYEHTISYYGSSDLQAVIQDLNKHHKSAASKNKINTALSYTLQHDQNTIYFTEYDMVQAEINWVRNNGLFDAKNTPTITLFNQYFGGNMSALVFQTIRESKALAYSTYAVYSSPSNTSTEYRMQAYVGTQADKIGEAVPAMNDLLTTLPKAETSFTQAQSAIMNSIESERITGMSIINYYLAQKRKGLDYDTRQDTYRAVPTLGFEDINTFYKQHIAGKTYTYTILGAKSKINFDLLKSLNCKVVELSVDELMRVK